MRITYNAPVILSFTLICVLIMIGNDVTGGRLSTALFAVYPNFEPQDLMSYIRLLSHIFGHKDWNHLTANFAFVLLIGPILEEKYGSVALLKMMLATAFVTGLIVSLFFSTGLMGASGIVFMLILLSSFTNFRAGEIPLTFILIVALYLTQEVMNAFSRDSISQFAHILGGLFGCGFGFLFTVKKQSKRVY